MSQTIPVRRVLPQLWRLPYFCLHFLFWVDQLHIPQSPDDRLVTFPSIKCRFPCFRELSDAMPHNKWKFAGFNRDLIKNISMIAMKSLPFRCLIIWIKCPGICNYCTTHCETALFLESHCLNFAAFFFGFT